MKRLRAAVVLLVPFCLIAQQTAASLSGVVKDSDGRVVVGASLTATNGGTALAKTVKTNGNGEYIFPLLQPGPYLLSIEAPSFKKEIQQNIVLQVGQDARVDAVLSVGASTEEIVITANEAVTDTESAAVGTVIDNKKVVEAPIATARVSPTSSGYTMAALLASSARRPSGR